MDNKRFNLKNILILVLIFIILILLLNNSSHSQNHRKVAHTGKNIAQKISNIKMPSTSPLTTMKIIIGNYKNCINDNKCPITKKFRSISSSYIKNGGKLNPITRLSSNFINPQYHIITELTTIAIIETYNQNGTNKIEYNFLNRSGVWKLNSTNCFNNPASEITKTTVPACN
ncbi:hypothetical protein M1145_03105 [Patescibacteria group bacterium]|nr:hypothetical protein [Patescibacteria group bacterium]